MYKRWKQFKNKLIFDVTYIGLLVLLIIAVYMLTRILVVSSREPETPRIIINPEATECVYYAALERTGWKRVAEDDNNRLKIPTGVRPTRIMPAQTLSCVDYSSCSTNENKCQLTRFRLKEIWYTTRKTLPRAVITE